MIRIHRSMDDNALIVQVIVGKTKAYLDADKTENLEDDIRRAAEAMGGCGEDALASYWSAINSMRQLSSMLKNRLDNIMIPEQLAYVVGGNRDLIAEVDKFWELDELISETKLLTHSEIYWMDWFLRKHKILGVSNG